MAQIKSQTKPFLAIFLVISLLTLVSFVLLGLKKDASYEALQIELQSEIGDLERSLVDLRLMNENAEGDKRKAEMQSEIRKQQLEEASAKINGLEEKLARMEKEQQADQALIEKLKAKVAEAKSTLLDNYKREISSLFNDNVYLIQKSDSLEWQLAVKDSLCRLEEKIEGKQAWLKVENMKLLALMGDKSEEGASFKKNKIETLKVVFDLVGMGPVPNNTKQIFMLLENSRREVMQDAKYKRSWFSFKGHQLPYSTKLSYDYAGTPGRLSMFFDPEKGEFLPGTYQIKLYTESDLIGQREIVIL